nr:plasmid partitioning protein RepB C-terminal domain-containing protein [Rhizobium leguminosarum]
MPHEGLAPPAFGQLLDPNWQPLVRHPLPPRRSDVSPNFEKGEERLLRAVESGQIPFSVALEIAEAEDHDTQAALQSAYEKKLLRGRKPIIAKRVAEVRRQRGKKLGFGTTRPKPRPMSSEALLKAFEADVDRKRLLIRRAETAKARLTFITEAASGTEGWIGQRSGR